MPILFRKFKLLGVRGSALGWLWSALTGRSQCVKLRDIVDGKFEKDMFSYFVPINRGTPQGGILFPRFCTTLVLLIWPYVWCLVFCSIMRTTQVP